MRFSAQRLALITAVVGALAISPLLATTLVQMNLGDLVQRADRIYRGTVVGIDTGTVSAGGGELPTITYTIQVDQAFKGTFETIKDQQFATFTTLGKMEPLQAGPYQRLTRLPEIPEMEIGRSYLLFTTRPSGANLSSPVGLGQGCFDIKMKGDQEVAVNQFRNIGLFRGMDVTDIAAQGPVSYERLTGELATTLARQEGGTP
jgi:hypothetical protein